jgi:hypothetical protein
MRVFKIGDRSIRKNFPLPSLLIPSAPAVWSKAGKVFNIIKTTDDAEFKTIEILFYLTAVT